MLASSEEPHVSPAHTIVGVTSTGEHPLGPGLSTAIGAEEVEEDCSVQWLDSLLAEVVVVCIDLVAAVVVGALSVRIHQS